MHVERSITYHADLETVLGVLVSSDLASARAKAGGLDHPEHTLTREHTAPEAVTVVTVPAEKLPDKARKLVSRTTVVTITQVWDGRGPERATASFTVDVGSLPVTIRLTQTLVAQGETTLSTFEGDVKVSIPFIGSKLEQLAASKVDAVLAADHRIVNSLLAAR